MLDDLRNASAYIEEEEEEPIPQAQTVVRPRRVRSYAAQSSGKLLGMTAVQRFILSLMLFMMVLILGVIALVASGSIYLPF